MLRSVIICPDRDFAQNLVEFLSESGEFGVACKVENYPNAVETVRLLRLHTPQVIFLGMDSPASASEIVAVVEQSSPGTQFVALHRTCDSELLLEAMRLGMREFLSLPFSRQTYHEMTARLEESLGKNSPQVTFTDLVFSFLPAKAGVGASTVALNASTAISKHPDTNVLLCDLDLSSGILRFMLKLDNHHSVVDAAEVASKLDESLWPQLVTSIGRLDVLHAGRLNPNVRIEGSQVRHLMEFARRNYRAVCVDLSGNLEKYSVEIMHESKRIYLVCTPEIPSLHLAREKYQYLQSLELGDRVGLLLNRAQKRSVINTAQIENLLGLPVEMTFPNDYQTVQKAVQAGKVVETASELGRQFSRLASVMVGPQADPAKEDSKKKRSGLFSGGPGRFSLFSGGEKTASGSR